jgi:hypothetical protein
MCCGDGVCDGPETFVNCAADCNGEGQEQEPEDGGSRCGGEVVTLEVDGVERCYSVGYAPSTPAARVLVTFHGSGGSALACGRDTSDTGIVGASQAVGDLVSVCAAAVAGQWDTAAMEVNRPIPPVFIRNARLRALSGIHDVSRARTPSVL